MGKVRPGNKKNSALNGEWKTHVKKKNGGKRVTSRARRAEDKKEIRTGIKEEKERFDEDDGN